MRESAYESSIIDKSDSTISSAEDISADSIKLEIIDNGVNLAVRTINIAQLNKETESLLARFYEITEKGNLHYNSINLELIEELMKKVPEYGEVYAARGELEIERIITEKLDPEELSEAEKKAAQMFGKASLLDPDQYDSGTVPYIKSIFCKSTAEKREYFSEAYTLAPFNSLYVYKLSELINEEGNPEEAVSIINNALSSGKLNTRGRLLVLKGEILMDSFSKVEEAIDVFREAVNFSEKEKDFAEANAARLYLSRCLAYSGRTKEAEEIYDEILFNEHPLPGRLKKKSWVDKLSLLLKKPLPTFEKEAEYNGNALFDRFASEKEEVSFNPPWMDADEEKIMEAVEAIGAQLGDMMSTIFSAIGPEEDATQEEEMEPEKDSISLDGGRDIKSSLNRTSQKKKSEKTAKKYAEIQKKLLPLLPIEIEKTFDEKTSLTADDNYSEEVFKKGKRKLALHKKVNIIKDIAGDLLSGCPELETARISAEIYPSVYTLINLAKALIISGEYSEAEEVLSKIFSISQRTGPDRGEMKEKTPVFAEPDAVILRAFLKIIENNNKEALELIDKLLCDSSMKFLEYPGVAEAKAMALIFSREYKVAIELMQNTLSQGIKRWTLYYLAALGHYNLDEFDSALKYVEEALKTKPGTMLVQKLKSDIKIKRESLKKNKKRE